MQNYDIRLGTNGADEWSWNRGALRLFYHSDDGLGAQASCLPFASGARQTAVAESYPEDQVIRAPRDASGVSRARGKWDASLKIIGIKAEFAQFSGEAVSA